MQADIPSVSINPIGDRVVVHMIEKQSESGFIIPDTVKRDKPTSGVVLAVGDGSPNSINPNKYMKAGDTVIFGKYAGDEITLHTEGGKDMKVKILHVDSILGVVR